MKASFEQDWRDKLHQEEHPPPGFVWENIKAELDKDIEKRPFVYWWRNPAFLRIASAVMLVMLLGVGYQMYDVSNETNFDSKIVSSNENEINKNPQVDQKPSNTASVEENQGYKQESITNAAEPKNGRSNALSLSQYPVSNRPNLEKTGALDKKSTSTAIEQTGDLESKLADLNIDLDMNLDESLNAFHKEMNDELMAASFSDLRTIAFGIPKQISYPIPVSSFLMPQNIAYELAYDPPSNTKPKSNVHRNWVSFNMSSNAYRLNPNRLNTSSNTNYVGGGGSTNGMEIAATSSNVGTPTPVSSADVYKSTFSTLQNSNYSPNSSFSQGRDLSIELLLSKNFKNKFELVSGISFSKTRINQASNEVAIDANTGAVTNTAFAAIESDKLRIVTIGTTSNNRFTNNTISIPIEIQKNLSLSRKMQIGFVAGFSNDFLVKTWLKSDNIKDQSLAPKSSSSFRTYTVSGLGGGVLKYALAKNWKLTARATYQKYLMSGLISNDSYSAYPSTFGLAYGLEYSY
ncbi:MAG: hypothetical protein ACRCVT_14155 [Leadbetterella sp.]